MDFFIYIFGFLLLITGFFLYLKLKIKQIKHFDGNEIKKRWEPTLLHYDKNVNNLFIFFLTLTFLFWGGIVLYQLKYSNDLLIESKKILQND
jgi:hypothetical protein